MRGCEKIQLLGEPSVLKILGSTFMEVIAIYLPGPRSCVECDCVCVQKKDMVASEKKEVCVQTKAVCVLKRRPCVYWKEGRVYWKKCRVYWKEERVCIKKKAVCVEKKNVCTEKKTVCTGKKKEKRVCVIPSLITGISPKDNFVCSHFFPSTDHLFLQ